MYAILVNKKPTFIQTPKGFELSLTESRLLQIAPIMRHAFPIQLGMLCIYKDSPNRKLSKMIKNAPPRANKKGVYVKDLLVFQTE